MIIGIPKEIKDHEFRVAVPPEGVHALTGEGHTVRVERSAGAGSGFADADYAAAGAELVDTDAAFDVDLVLKVKEPQPSEMGYFRAGQVLFTYLHLAASREMTKNLLETGVTAIAYEAVEDGDGRLPLLKPMSEVAGALAVMMGATFLERRYGGRGLLLSGIEGVSGGGVTVLGAGVVGTSATRVATGIGAHVTVLDRSEAALGRLARDFPNAAMQVSDADAVAAAVASADLVVGGVLIPGAHAPRIVTRQMIGGMQPGSVIVDVSIDQGGCVEGIRETSHTEPTYLENGIVMSAIPNLPGVVPLTSTQALAQATLPYVRSIAAEGWEEAARRDAGLARGVRMTGGQMVHQGIAETFGLPYTSLS
ncbi:MAG: alanine dehydrogenase [Leptospirillia bacterium]